jgi:REP element-mobilizing transposase RayT
MTKYQNKYRVESTRLKEWDYTNPWWYYVTICTKEHQEYFGKIENEKMILNELGKFVDDEWLKTAQIRKKVELDDYVIMPNHLHGIIILNETDRRDDPVGRLENSIVISKKNSETMQRIVSTETLKANSLGSIIGQFKSAVTKRAKEKGINNFAWQPRFYDRIIRNEKELYNIRKYIQQNPLKWDLEKHTPENIDL